MNHMNIDNEPIPIPQHFVVTACYGNKIKFAWHPVGKHSLYRSFEYQILCEPNNGQRQLRKTVKECEATIDPIQPGAEYTFYVRTVETTASLLSEVSEALDVRIPYAKEKYVSIEPRASKWTNDPSGNITFSWKSPFHFYGDVSYELLFNQKVLGRLHRPPMVFPKKELNQFDLSSGDFKVRSVIISNKDKRESKGIIISQNIKHQNQRNANVNAKVNNQLSNAEEVINNTEVMDDNSNNNNNGQNDDNDDRRIDDDDDDDGVNAHNPDAIEEKKEISELEIKNTTDDSNIIYIWICAPEGMPPLTLVPYGDADFAVYKFKKLDEENGIYLCAWPSYFVNELDHYFLFGTDAKIKLAVMPTYDTEYKEWWKIRKGKSVKLFLVYEHKLLHRFNNAMAGGVAGQYSNYECILECIVRYIDNGISLKSAIRTIAYLHELWQAQQQSIFAELKDFFFRQLEYFVDSIEFRTIDKTQISQILLLMFFLLRTQRTKVHYRHLEYALKSLLVIFQSRNMDVVDFFVAIMGKYVIEFRILFEEFVSDRLKRKRCRYFDLIWYNLLYLSSLKYTQNTANINGLNKKVDLEVHRNEELMSNVEQHLFNPNFTSRPIGQEDLPSITDIYIGLLKDRNNQSNDQFYPEQGIRIEELLIENHIQSDDILDTIDFIEKYQLSWKIFAAILYRNQYSYTFIQYSDGKEYLPELSIAADIKSPELLSKSGFYELIGAQKVPTPARCAVVHLIFINYQKGELNEKYLICWFRVIVHLILSYKDFRVADQILTELQYYVSQNIPKSNRKWERLFNSVLQSQSNNANSNFIFQKSLPVLTDWSIPLIPHSLVDATKIHSQILYHMLNVLLHFRYQKSETINGDDFLYHLYGILMLQLKEYFHAEKYLMKAICKKANSPYGFYFSDLALLKIKQLDFVCAFSFIQHALNKNPREEYNKLILLLLYKHLSTKNNDLYNVMGSNYMCNDNDNNNDNNEEIKESKQDGDGGDGDGGNGDGDGDDDDDEDDSQGINNTLIDKCLYYHFRACAYLEQQKWEMSIQSVNEIYKYIGKINVKKIRKYCHAAIVGIQKKRNDTKQINLAPIKHEEIQKPKPKHKRNESKKSSKRRPNYDDINVDDSKQSYDNYVYVDTINTQSNFNQENF